MITEKCTQQLLLQLRDIFYPKLNPNQTYLSQLKEVYKCLRKSGLRYLSA